MIAISSASLSLTSTGTIGTSCRPAICEARQRRSPAMISKRSCAPLTGRTTIGWITPCCLIESESSPSSASEKVAARIARIGFEKFDRHLALRARPLQMRGLAADISDQTCKTAAQSRTRFVGHRQLPWIHSQHSGIRICSSIRRVGKARAVTHQIFVSLRDGGHGADALCPPYDFAQCVRSSRSRWITSVASLR